MNTFGSPNWLTKYNFFLLRNLIDLKYFIIMKNKHFFMLFFVLLYVQITIAQTTTTVTNITEFNEAIKAATPGSKIILKNGEWKDVHFKAHAIGTKEAPIVISAETSGEVIITGDSRLNISGEYVIVNGLWFKDGTPTSKYLIEFRKDSKVFANNCRLMNTTVSYFNPTDNSIENHWVDMWGKNNRVDHCNFTGKLNGGTTLVVWLKGEEHVENHHQIDHNFFGNRPDLGENGGETIRIGTSENSMKSSKTLVEYNTFRGCDGEIEIISNKSCDNIYRSNLFIESEGTLTLRHGNNALVENNVFIGNNKPRVGGVRIINAGHIIQNNFFLNIVGDDYRGPIVVMNGVPNSPLNRYNQVKNVVVQNNTLINCSPIQIGAGVDSEKTLAPESTIFANNLISNTDAGKIMVVQSSANGVKFSGNIVDSEVAVDPAYFTKATVDWALLQNLPMPTSDNEALKLVQKIPQSPKVDMAGSERTVFVAGAFNLDNTIIPSVFTVKAGPFWNPVIEERALPEPSAEPIIVEPGVETLSKAIKKAGLKGTLLLNPGTYLVQKSMKVSGDVTIKGNGDGVIIQSDAHLEKDFSYFFRVNEGGRLTLDNVTVDGDGGVIKYAIVSPDENLAGAYSVFVENTYLQNFTNESGGSVFKAYAGTFADTISFKNSVIQDSYRGLNLSYEKTFGKYSAELVLLYNTVFRRMEEFAVNYVREGVNPANNGGQLEIDHCVFSRVYNSEKGYFLRTKGIENVAIKNSVFEDSHLVVTSVNLSGLKNSIYNCLVYATGSIKATNGAKSNEILYKNPKWDDYKLFIPSQKSSLLKENNGIGEIGLVTPLKK